MSSLTQIEAAVAQLPPEEQRSLLEWLQDRVPPAASGLSSHTQSLSAFRELQREAALTPAAAQLWKAAVSDARR